MTQPIDIVLAFNDFFWAPAYAVMRSVCLTTHRRTDLRFHILTDGIAEEHRRDLIEIESEFGASLIYYDLNQSPDFAALSTKVRGDGLHPSIVYARLIFDRLLPPTIQRVIYLDSDTLVLTDIAKLLETDLEGHALGGVLDPSWLHAAFNRDIRNNRDLYDPADPYFNSGVLVIDVEKWREADLMEHVERLKNLGILHRLYHDQGLLNLVFRNRFKVLDPRWNMLSPGPDVKALGPYILHYTGRAKPWHLNAPVAHARAYRHIMTNALFYRYWRYRLRHRILPF